MKDIELIEFNGRPISVGVGSHCFSIEDSVVKDSEAQRLGSEFKSQEALEYYEECFQLAKWAWENQIFDKITSK